jgi:TonB family protein
VIHQTDPEFSGKARRAHYQGTCVLSVMVGEDGKPRDIKVTRPLGMDLAEQAVEAVSAWRFEPARKDGNPVPIQIAVEVNFHMYGKNDTKIAALMGQAAGGDAKAELELSTVYFEGRDLDRSESLGLMYLERAAKHGLPKVQFLMAEHLGQGRVPDYPKAFMWYTLAQQGGSKQGDGALEKLSARMTPEQIQAGQALVNEWNAPAK